MTQQDKIKLSPDRVNAILGEFSLVGIDLNQVPADQLNQILQGVNDLIGQGKSIEQAVNSFLNNTKTAPEKQKGQELGAIIDQQADLISDQLSDQLSSLIWSKTWSKTWSKLAILPEQPVNNFLAGVNVAKASDTVYLLTGGGSGNN